MHFMLQIEVTTPQMSPNDLQELYAREKERGKALVEQGTLVSIWRTVGRRANVSFWQAETLEGLHEAVSSLPMFPYMQVQVTALVAHPLTLTAQEAQARLTPH
jgi:muconolactone D-isomerase